jgi:hypothetical protein
MTQKNLSKSKLLSYRQCPRRLWLEIHRPELSELEGTEARFAAGGQVGAVARRLYDPEDVGTIVDRDAEGLAAAFERTRTLLNSPGPVFEAGLVGGGVLAFADVMLPDPGPSRGWRMIEVKASTYVKDYHCEDAAIQAYAAGAAGIPLSAVHVACIDNSWVYGGDGDYRGLLYETDVTSEVRELGPEVRGWVADAQRVASRDHEPAMRTGAHCEHPFSCPFQRHCGADESQPEYPSAWLPRVMKPELRQLIANGATDMRDVPDTLLNARQLRVKRHTLSGRPSLRRKSAAALLRGHTPPACFMDFESVQFAVPIWKGTRPYQQIPFQFSIHRLSRSRTLAQFSFLDLSGSDPSQVFAEALITAVEGSGPVFVYSAPFERMCLRELGERVPRLAPGLDAINDRIVDLLPIVRESYYHPSQQGTWGLKAVLPAIAPDLDYASLDGVQDGGMAAAAYLEATDSSTHADRKNGIERELLTYCERDTLALVRIYQFLTRSSLKSPRRAPGAGVS